MCNTLNKLFIRAKYVTFVNQTIFALKKDSFFYVEPFCYHSNNEGYNKYIHCRIMKKTRQSDAFHLGTVSCNKPHAVIGQSIEEFFLKPRCGLLCKT